MATVHRDAIARLLPPAPPGLSAIAVRELAAETYPTLQLGSVIALLHSLTDDGLVVQVDELTRPVRYHLPETS